MPSAFRPPAAPGDPIYLSGPKALHGTAVWQAAIDCLAHQFPAATIWSPAQVFRSRADWRADLASRLGQCAALVFLTDAEGWLGKGVDTEIATARAMGIPIGWLTRSGDLVPVGEVQLGSPNEDDWTRYRRAQLAETVASRGIDR